MRKRPSYTGTIGQWRQRCLQPRLASVYPATLRSPPFCSVAYRSAAGRPLRSGTRNASRAIEGRSPDQRGLRGFLAPPDQPKPWTAAGQSGAATRHPGNLDQILLELAVEDIDNAPLPQQLLIQRRIQPVRTQTRLRIQGSYLLDDRNRKSRRRVHRKEKGDEAAARTCSSDSF